MKLIIDSQSLAYTFVFDMSSLSHGQSKTGIIYGFLKKILSLAQLYQTTEFIFAWDSRQSYRKMDFPDMKYKERPVDPKNAEVIKAAREQFVLLRKEILPAMGFQNVFMFSGYEADDIIAHICINFPVDYTIVSGDQDLYQLLNIGMSATQIHDVRTDKIIDEDNFLDKYGLNHPSQWIEIKAMAGCSSDNVPGIKGIGQDTAIKYIKGELKKGKAFDKIMSEEGMLQYHKCKRLVELPYEGDRPIIIDKLQEDFFWSLDMIDIFKKYGLHSFVKNMDEWREAFNILPGRM